MSAQIETLLGAVKLENATEIGEVLLGTEGARQVGRAPGPVLWRF